MANVDNINHFLRQSGLNRDVLDELRNARANLDAAKWNAVVPAFAPGKLKDVFARLEAQNLPSNNSITAFISKHRGAGAADKEARAFVEALLAAMDWLGTCPGGLDVAAVTGDAEKHLRIMMAVRKAEDIRVGKAALATPIAMHDFVETLRQPGHHRVSFSLLKDADVKAARKALAGAADGKEPEEDADNDGAGAMQEDTEAVRKDKGGNRNKEDKGGKGTLHGQKDSRVDVDLTEDKLEARVKVLFDERANNDLLRKRKLNQRTQWSECYNDQQRGAFLERVVQEEFYRTYSGQDLYYKLEDLSQGLICERRRTQSRDLAVVGFLVSLLPVGHVLLDCTKMDKEVNDRALVHAKAAKVLREGATFSRAMADTGSIQPGGYGQAYDPPLQAGPQGGGHGSQGGPLQIGRGY